MGAFKRKRGGQVATEKQAKKAKFVAGGGDTATGTTQEKKNEVVVPGPVSMVSTRACYLLLEMLAG